MDQDITHLVLPSCFDKQAFQYTSLGGQQAARLVAEWEFTDVITHHSKAISYSETDLAKSIVCKKCIK
jgi:N-methylhydantoinase A/oxoprolinase/acetone carboxylase beta subunit